MRNFAKPILLVLALVSGQVRAQISDLRTTDDGSVLMFASSLRLHGSNGNDLSKVFRWDGAFSLVSDTSPLNEYIPSYAFGPVMSGDGSVFAYVKGANCPWNSFFCGFSPTIVFGGRFEKVFSVFSSSFVAQISHNGRYAAIGSTGSLQHFDLVTGEAFPLVASPWGITDSGQVLMLTASGAYLMGSPGNSRQVVAGENIRAAAVSADGSRVVYTQERDGKLELRSGGTLIRSIDARYGAGFGVLLSNDGNRASVREFLDPVTVHALWLDCATMELHDLGPARDGTAAISGNGRLLWMFQPDGYLARVSLDTSERMLIGDPLPVIEHYSGAPTPGSFNSLYGAGFTPDRRWSITLTNGDRNFQAPVLGAAPDRLDYQIPWGLDTQALVLRFGFTHGMYFAALSVEGGVFEQLLLVRSFGFAPQFATDAPAQPVFVKAAHQDYHGLVTADDPAWPGEVIHIYMTGWGEVTPPQSDGIPAPGDPPARTVAQPVCGVEQQGNPSERQAADTVFSGLAPGMVGVYLLDLQLPSYIPADWTNPLLLRCQSGDPAYLPVLH